MRTACIADGDIVTLFDCPCAECTMLAWEALPEDDRRTLAEYRRQQRAEVNGS